MPMAMSVWLRWEKSFDGRWQPVCYHGEKPRQPRPEDAQSCGVAIPVPEDFIEMDGTPNFGRLVKRFPPPAPVEDQSGGAAP